MPVSLLELHCSGSSQVLPVRVSAKAQKDTRPSERSKPSFRLQTSPIAAALPFLAFVSAELPAKMETITTVSDYAISEPALKTFCAYVIDSVDLMGEHEWLVNAAVRHAVKHASFIHRQALSET